MIYVAYDGRLGNQLFQLAAGINLSIDNNCQLFVPPSQYYKFINYKPEIYLTPSHTCEFVEPTFHFSEINYKPGMLLKGYYQSEKYFYSNRDIVVNGLKLKDNYLLQIKEKYKDILDYETISIHVRRTDYLILSDRHPTLPVSYYKKALDLIGTKNKKILIFSDDINWCRRVFEGKNFIFVENNIDIVDMFLMSLCNNNIIANSSFSWWGAYFNNNLDKKVVAPLKWFGCDLPNDTKDLYCKDWIVI